MAYYFQWLKHESLREILFVHLRYQGIRIFVDIFENHDYKKACNFIIYDDRWDCYNYYCIKIILIIKETFSPWTIFWLDGKVKHD